MTATVDDEQVVLDTESGSGSPCGTHPQLSRTPEVATALRNPTYMLVTAAGVVTRNPTGALLGCLCIDQSGSSSSYGTGRSVMTSYEPGPSRGPGVCPV